MTLLGDGFKPANYFNSYFMPTGGEYQRQDLRVTFESARTKDKAKAICQAHHDKAGVS
jgi:hypothetical protein